MSDSFTPIFPDEGDWPPVNPQAQSTVVIPNIAAGSISNDKLSNDIDPRKIMGHGIKVSLSAGQAVANATTEVIEYGVTDYNQGFPPLSSTFLVTAPYGGVYLVVMGMDWSGSASQVDDEGGFIDINGAPEQAFRSPNLVNNRQRYTIAATFLLDAGDTIGGSVRHTSGASRTLGTSNPERCNLSVTFLFSL